MLGHLRAVRCSLRASSALGLGLAAAAIVALTAGIASASSASSPGVAIDFAAPGYKILRTPPPTGWEQPGFNDSTWATVPAPFGNNAGCSFPTATTPFDSLETIFLRRTFTVPDNAFGLHIAGTIDNVVDFWVNGHGEGDASGGNCATGTIDVDVPSGDLSRGSGNPDDPDDEQLIAAKAVGMHAGSPSFFDMQVSYGVVVFGQQPTETLELSTIAPAPTVTITDAEGHAVGGQNVTVLLQAINGSGTFTSGSTTSAVTSPSGLATFGNLAVTQPGRYRLVATSAGAQVASANFAVDDLAFGVQPSETQKGVVMSPAPTVTIKDPYGAGIPNKTVQVTLQTINGTGTLVGAPLSATTNNDGVATFSNVTVTDVGKYKLVATSDNTSATSGGFLIANQVTPCTGSCKASGSVPNNTAVVASATNAAGSLAVSVFGGITPPAGVCTGFVPLGAGSFVNILQSGSTLPDFTITWQLDKSLVKKAGSPGASKFNICLGAEDLLHPDGSGATPWKTKSGGNAVAVADADLGITLFWGILPDCPKKGKATGPCVLHRNKTNAGDVVVTFFKPAPWDGHMYGG